ncbi:MAG: CotH kinase family protein [Treponema sp.]|jgi:hypothetical protein|nr:CotH kinase family protein [Treponema sp.]
MRIKFSINKIICLLMFALCYLFVTCEEPGGSGDMSNNGEDGYGNPNVDVVRELTFSHNSGLYGQQFSLTIRAPEGSSIYYSTDGSVPSAAKAGNGYVFKYNAPITVQNRNGQANVLATPQNSENFYMVPNDSRGDVPPVYTPTNAQVPKATVIRAIAVDANGVSSGVATKTYFIGNNLADYGSNRVISLVSDPYNLVDVNYGIMVRGNSSNRWDTNPSYNFRMKGEAWERPAHLELFEGNGSSRSIPLSTGVGIRIRGGYSRGVGQKSFSVYFKEQYGIKNLENYNLIPGAVKADGKTPVGKYKGFMLRNGANDIEYKFYDVFLQNLLSDRSFSTQAAVPCVVYINGEYWGPYNLQERYSDNHTEYKYGVKKENVISYDNGELDDGNPGEESLFNDMMNMANNDMSVPANYSAFCAAFDIDNFIDYWAAQIYIYNEDWPHNNYRLWRTRTVESGNPYGDTKWRYQMFDTEFALGIYNSGGLTGGSGKNAFDEILNGSDKDHPNNKLFKALMVNPDFCKKFVNTMLDLYNVNFHPNNFGPKLDSYANIYRPLMDGYFSRWGKPWDSAFNDKVNDARSYLNDIRNAMVNYLPNYFGGKTSITSGNLYDVTLSTAGANVSIKINTVTPNLPGSWTGKYYSAVPITVTASAPPNGYEFEGWLVTGGTAVSLSALTTVVTITGNAQITAKYKLTGSTVIPVTGVSLNKTSVNLKIGETSALTATVTPSNATYKDVIWTSSNSAVASVSNGKVTAISGGTATITANTVEGKSATCAVTVKFPTVLFDLAAKLQTLSVQTLDTDNKFYTAFSGMPVRAGNAIDVPYESNMVLPHVTYNIISDSGVIKLQVNVFVDWGAGLVVSNDNFTFKTGDIIEFKGKMINGPSDGIRVDMNCWGYEPLRDWNESYLDGQVFDKTFILTADEAATINANAIKCDGNALKFQTGGISPWNGTVYPVGIGKFVIEQIKIFRIE